MAINQRQPAARCRLVSGHPHMHAALACAAARRRSVERSCAPKRVRARVAPPGRPPPACRSYGHPGPNPPKHRRAGVILHPTSLPGKYGMGEIGAEAFAFVDWLAATGMQLWQVRLGGRGRLACRPGPCLDLRAGVVQVPQPRMAACANNVLSLVPAWGPAPATPVPATLGLLPQLLPLVPPETTYWSPYSGLDALCGNTLLLPIDELIEL